MIHDKMDHAKTTLPRLQMCNKMIYRLGQLPIILTCMIVHGHGDERCSIFESVVPKWSHFHNYIFIVALSHFGNSFGCKVKTIVWRAPTKFILCLSFIREIALRSWIAHTGKNYWCSAFVKWITMWKTTKINIS
jgi:hypothetical protein